ncbi:MAG TPA: hypothetical protein VLG09_04195 [Candidatus Saccharimonadales bacterium]|nr:hypothetical protein [Candidatus Saccharimonadales bacterium]
MAVPQHPDPKEAATQSQELVDLERVIEEAGSSDEGYAEPPQGSEAMTVSWGEAR